MVMTKNFHNVPLCLSSRTVRTFRGNMLHSSLKYSQTSSNSRVRNEGISVAGRKEKNLITS